MPTPTSSAPRRASSTSSRLSCPCCPRSTSGSGRAIPEGTPVSSPPSSTIPPASTSRPSISAGSRSSRRRWPPNPGASRMPGRSRRSISRKSARGAGCGCSTPTSTTSRSVPAWSRGRSWPRPSPRWTSPAWSPEISMSPPVRPSTTISAPSSGSPTPAPRCRVRTSAPSIGIGARRPVTVASIGS